MDSAGNAYVTGVTESEDFPTTPDALDTNYNGVYLGGDTFIAKLNPVGSALTYSTYLGSTEADRSYGIVTGNTGSGYVTGTASSTGFPTTPGAFNDSGGVFVVRLALATCVYLPVIAID